MIERFLIPRDAPLHIDDLGFVSWPDDEYAAAYNPGLRSWSDVSNHHVLVVLGEPGLGKSTFLDHVSRQDTEIASRWIDLGTYSDQTALERAVFGPQGFADGASSAKPLVLFLDGLDESKVSIPTVERCLRQSLQCVDADLLRLRVSCRTAVWSNQLEEFLFRKWGKDRVAVLELVPLRAVDARVRAVQTGINPDAFLAEVKDRGVGALAARPITLNFLLDIFSTSGALPQSRYEIYRRGCLHLVEEKNPGRVESRRTGKLSAPQRLELAGKIAAVSMFANRGLLTARDQIEPIDSGIICPADILTKLPGQPRLAETFGHADYIEVLDTGLFNARGANLLGWAHQSFAEFLAAHHLAENRMDVPTAISLFRNVNDPGRRVAPQLWETAAWYSMRDSEFLEWLISSEPEIVLESDVHLSDDAMRKAVVGAILEKAHASKYFDTDLSGRRRYTRLAHSKLAEQLYPYVLGKQYGRITRRIATDIAQQCKVEALADSLAAIALDKTEEHHVRVNAAYAVLRIAERSAKERLRPLLAADQGDDDDELRGVAIKALWPGSLAATELFDVLTPPKRPNFHGAYATLFHDGITAHLNGPDCVPALEWVERLTSEQLQDFTLGGFADSVMQRAVKYLTDKSIAGAFARTAWRLLGKHDAIFVRRWGGSKPASLLDDSTLRRRVASVLLQLCKDPEKDGFKLFHQGERVLRDEDIDWLIEELKSADANRQRILAGLIAYRLRYPIDHDVISRVMDLSFDPSLAAAPVLRQAISWLLEPIELDSPTAEDGRRHLAMMRELEDRPTKRKRPLAISDHLEQGLRRSQSDAVTGWMIVLNAMSRSGDEAQIGWIGDDILETAAWRTASEGLRDRIRTAAWKYLRESSESAAELSGKETFNLSELAPVPALIVVALGGGSLSSLLTTHIWAKHARALIVCLHSNERINLWETLLRSAADGASDALRNAFSERLDYEFRKGGYVHVTGKIVPIWDKQYENVVFDVMSRPTITSETLRSLGNFVFARSPVRARTAIQEMLGAPQDRSGNDDVAITCAALLTRNDAPQSWASIWPMVHGDWGFGRKWALAVAAGHREESSVFAISESQLADLYIWLEHAFPPAEDPELNGWVSPRHEIAELRRGVLKTLANRGTLAALDNLDRIVREIPGKEWLRALRFDAEKRVRHGTWIPLSPQEVRAALENLGAVVVRDDEELREAILASLAKLQDRMHGIGGAPRLVPTLWDEHSKRPKTEPRLSECIELHLRDDIGRLGVIVNREVEISNYRGLGLGERVDLLVSCHRRAGTSHSGSLALAIEVKGCWNAHLHEAMETQLVQRYLSKGGLQAGLYVVGYFQCPNWADDDQRKADSLRNTSGDLSALSQRFVAQAARLTSERFRVSAFVLDARW
jgi:hypothetical protein